MVAFAVAATNLRNIASFAKRPTEPAKTKRGRPRKRGVLDFAEVFENLASANAPPEVA